MDYIIGLLISFLAMGWYNCYYRLKNKNFIENEYMKVTINGRELNVDVKGSDGIDGISGLNDSVYSSDNVVPFKKG